MCDTSGCKWLVEAMCGKNGSALLIMVRIRVVLVEEVGDDDK